MTLANTAIVSLLAVAAPILGRAASRAAVPVIVVELLLGIAAGPHGLGWVDVDDAVSTLALPGVTFLFFLAGLDVDLSKVHGRLLAGSLASYALGLTIAFASSVALGAAGLLQTPPLVAIAFSATGLGLVVPILRNAALIDTPTGSRVIAFASVAEFAAVVLLAVAFGSAGTPLGSLLLLTALAVLALLVTALGKRFSRSRRVTALVDGLSGGTVQLRLRITVALVIGFAALAQVGGLEVVLGAFFAGGIVNVLDGSMRDPLFRAGLDGLGYGLFIPIFFVASGARLDFAALSLWPGALLLVPLLVLSLLVSRGAPAVLLRVGDTASQRFGAGLLCATSLPFIVTAAQVGVARGRLEPSTAAAMSAAGLLGVLLFPTTGVPLLRRSTAPTASRPRRPPDSDRP